MASFVFTGDPRAPGQDPKTCEMHGFRFELNGDPVEVEDEAKAEKLRRHSHFTEAGFGDKVRAAVGMKRPDELDGMNIAGLRELADRRGIQHDGLSKADLREKLRA